MIANASRGYSGSSRRKIARRGLFVTIGTLVLIVGLAAPAQAKDGGGNGGGHNGGGGGVDPNLISVTFTPSPVIGGGGVTASANFDQAASQGAVVDVTSSDPTVASVEWLGSDTNVANATAETVAVPGSSTAQFAIETTPVTDPTTVTITATHLGTGQTVTADLAVVPGTPPAPDTLRITKAEHKQLLTIEATDSNPNAIVFMFDPDLGTLGEPLTNEGGGKYMFQEVRDEAPAVITLVSNFGGEASAPVTE